MKYPATSLLLSLFALALVGCGEQSRVIGRIKSLDGSVNKRDGRVYYVNLFGSKITDAELIELGESESLSGIEQLNLGQTQISHDGLAVLSRFQKMEILWLQFTTISDDGLAHVAELKNLKSLDLRDVPVTDKGITHLEGLQSLELIDLSGTSVTAVGVQRLQNALPNCRVCAATLMERLWRSSAARR